MNDQLGLWEHSEDATEKWLLEQEENGTKDFEEFKDSVETVRGKIEQKQY